MVESQAMAAASQLKQDPTKSQLKQDPTQSQMKQDQSQVRQGESHNKQAESQNKQAESQIQSSKKPWDVFWNALYMIWHQNASLLTVQL